MFVACKAYEGVFLGTKGVEALTVFEEDPDEIEHLVFAWAGDAQENLIFDHGLDRVYDWEDYENGGYYFNKCGYIAYEIISPHGKDEDALDEELNTIGFNNFIEKYCRKEPLFYA